MSEEPFYIRQAQIKGGDKAKADWCRQAGEEARAEGATFCRVSYHPENGVVRRPSIAADD